MFDTVDEVVWWSILALAIVALVVAIVFVVRAAREAARLKRRAAGYAALPIVTALAQGELDVARINAAAARAVVLRARVDAAIAVLRRGPIPPDVIAAFATLRVAVNDLRTLEE